jgi:hypothetical protein
MGSLCEYIISGGDAGIMMLIAAQKDVCVIWWIAVVHRGPLQEAHGPARRRYLPAGQEMRDKNADVENGSSDQRDTLCWALSSDDIKDLTVEEKDLLIQRAKYLEQEVPLSGFSGFGVDQFSLDSRLTIWMSKWEPWTH